MDNDRKVTDLVEQSKSVFLSEAVQDFKRNQAQYDLGAEFAKTRKNRTLIVPGVIIAMILVFTTLAFVLNFTIDRQSQIVEVGASGFDQVNLRDVLQAWLRTEQRLTEIDRERAQLEQERDERLELLRGRTERSRQLARLRSEAGLLLIGPELARINRNFETSAQQLRLEYTGRLEALASERSEILERRENEFDAEQVEAALARQEILDDQRRLFDLELEQQREFLNSRISTLRDAYQSELEAFTEHRDLVERTLRQQFTEEIARLVAEHEAEIEALVARYNPDFGDEDVADLLDAPLSDDSPENSGGEEAFERALVSQGVITEDEVAAVRASVGELYAIVARLQEVPYENSVPQALDQIASRSRLLVADLNRLGAELTQSFENEVEAVAEQRDAVDRNLQQTRQDLSAVQGQLADVRGELARVESEADDRIARETDQLRQQLAQFEHAFGQLIQDDREDGYVVDPRNPDRIHVYLDPSRDIEAGVEAFVFREPEGLIGMVELFETDLGFRARLLSVADNRSIRPFDRVLLDIAGQTD
jgi:hypothetical protein